MLPSSHILAKEMLVNMGRRINTYDRVLLFLRFQAPAQQHCSSTVVCTVPVYVLNKKLMKNYVQNSTNNNFIGKTSVSRCVRSKMASSLDIRSIVKHDFHVASSHQA